MTTITDPAAIHMMRLSRIVNKMISEGLERENAVHTPAVLNRAAEKVSMEPSEFILVLERNDEARAFIRTTITAIGERMRNA